MAVEYLGLKDIGLTPTELQGLLGLKDSTPSDSTNMFFEFNDNGKKILICKGYFAYNNWNILNSKGLIFGKTITINNKRYKARTIKGADTDPTVCTLEGIGSGGEYKKYIVDYWSLLENNKFNSQAQCQETSLSDSYQNLCSQIVSGTYSVKAITKSSSESFFMYFPLLEAIAPYINCNVTDLGNLLLWDNNNTLKCTPYSNTSTTLKVNVYLDNTLLESHTCTSGVEFAIPLNSFNDLDYGKHIIKLIPQDISDGEVGEPIEVTFCKIKNPNPPLTDPNLTKLINQIKLTNEDMDYQLFRFREALKEKDVEVVDNEIMSSLIDKLDYMPFKKWASGVLVSNPLAKSMTGMSGRDANNAYPLVFAGLDFKPSLIYAYPNDGNASLFDISIVTSNNKLNSDINGHIYYTAYSATINNNTYYFYIGKDGANYYINSDGFSIPMYRGNTSYTWIAFE